MSVAGSAWHRERTRVLPLLCLFLNKIDLPAMWLLSHTDVMSQFVAGDLVVFIKSTSQCIMAEDGDLAVRSLAMALTSVSLIVATVTC